MKTILIIINGIKLPYHVVNYAIAEAKKNSSEIFVLFLKGKSEAPKGYGYPSDLAIAEESNSDKDAVTEDEKIIEDNINLVKSLVESEKIPYKSSLKTNVSLKEVIELSQSADLIVADEQFDESLLSQHKFSLKKLKYLNTKRSPMLERRLPIKNIVLFLPEELSIFCARTKSMIIRAMRISIYFGTNAI